MKKARVINGIVWGVMTIGIMVMVVAEWHSQGCGLRSLAAAVVFYGATGAGLWACIDQTIKDLSNPSKGGAQ